jgi:hypothetical protein
VCTGGSLTDRVSDIQIDRYAEAKKIFQRKAQDDRNL